VRIKRFELKAFGPFTNKVLEFPGELPGLHVIYGPNEAGKSCTLRGLTAWLYGFDERTRDNFLHSNDQLLVAGLLENGQGEELYVARRKKRKADLLDAAGKPVDPGLLAALLHGIDQGTFKKLFGLDYDTLVQGGTNILQEKGSAGTTLFSAGTGIAALRQILSDLHGESETIFKKQASRPFLNAALRDFANLKSQIHQASLSSRVYREHEKALRQAQRELEQEQEKRGQLRREQHRLERLQQAFNPSVLRQELQKRLTETGEIRPLPEDFSKRRSESQARFRAARQTLTAAKGRRQDFQDKAAAIQLNTELLDHTDTIRHLHQRLGAYRKGMSDLSTLEGKRVQEKTLAGNLLRRIRPDLPLEKAEELRPLLRRRRGISEGGGKLPLLEQQKITTARELRKIESVRSRTETLLRELPPAMDLLPLAEAIAHALHLGDIDASLEVSSEELSRNQLSFSCGLKQIGLWCGTPSNLLEVNFPLTVTVNRFAEDLRELLGAREELRKRGVDLEQQQKQLVRDIGAIEKTGEVPTEKELVRLRTMRDRGWTLLRRQWLAGEDVSAESRNYDPDIDLPEAYEQRVLQVDHTADRLRREAERVHKYAHLVVALEGAAQELAELAVKEAVLQQKLLEQEKRWQESWQPCGIAPLPPAEMAAWLSRVEQLRFQARQIVTEEEKNGYIRKQRLEAGKKIREALMAFQVKFPEGEVLSPLLQRAKIFQEQTAATEQKRHLLQEKLAELDHEISSARKETSEAEQALEDWQKYWREILCELGLSDRELPVGVEDFFEGLECCLNHLERAEEFRKRVIGIKRDAEQLEDKVQGLLERAAPELMSLAVDQAIEALSGLFSRARDDEVTLKAYAEEFAKAEEEIRQAIAASEIAGTELAELCKIAGCDRQEDLEEVERCWQERIRLQERIREEEERLLQLADGRSLVDLEAQIAQIDPDALPGQLLEISEELDQVNERISALAESIGRKRTELAAMDGGAEAARKAEEAEEKLAEVRRLAGHYARLRMAAKVLEGEIERYRAANQDPVLELAGGYFAKLTLGSFQGLLTDVDDKEEQVIVGLRKDGRQVQVEGMSAGTRDQLFLALRLASLEHRLKENEPMPFIVDDILLNFDEARARATLQALGKLAEKNQVILFSHHLHLLDILAGIGVGRVITL
jgi:uncharacterized protein YhaN